MNIYGDAIPLASQFRHLPRMRLSENKVITSNIKQKRLKQEIRVINFVKNYN